MLSAPLGVGMGMVASERSGSVLLDDTAPVLVAS